MNDQTKLLAAVNQAVEAIEAAAPCGGKLRVELETGRVVEVPFFPVDWKEEAKTPRGLFAWLSGARA